MAATEALTGTTPITDTKAAILLSDGASRLADRFQLATWTELMRIVITSGPEELLRQGRNAEASDPHGKRWPRGKNTMTPPPDSSSAPSSELMPDVCVG